MARQPNGRPTIYLGKDKLYHCWVPVGTKPNGDPHRKHVKRQKAAQVAEEVDRILERLKQGTGQLAKIETLEDWLNHWVHVVLAAKRDTGAISSNTWDDYESICRIHLIPSLGKWRISGTKRRLEPEHVEALWATLIRRDLSSSYVTRMHVAMNQALKLAFRRGRADRNVMELVDGPVRRKKKVKALPYDEACKVVGEAMRDPLAARWLLGIITGPRQGEALGIRWSQVELDPDPPMVAHIRLEQQIQRRKWQHGCKDPIACVKNRTTKDADGNDVPHNICKTNPCGIKYLHGCEGVCGHEQARYCPDRKTDGCWRHRTKDGKPKPCPPRCQPNCAGHASTCPQRKDGGLIETRLKTHASEEPLAIGTACAELLRRHRETQIREEIFTEDGYVFTGTDPSKPMDPRRDYDQWCALLARAGVRHHRLHATRHTAGSVLSATGADLPMIRDILRHADTAMTAAYVDFGLDARRDAVDRVAKALIDGDLSMMLGARKVA